MDRIIEVKINGNYVSKDNKNAGTQGEYNITSMRIEFDPGWDGYAKTITFWNAYGENPVKVILGDEWLEDQHGNSRIFLIKIPGEPLEEAGECSFVIDGVTPDGRQRSVEDYLMVKPAKSAEDAGQSAPPSLTVTEQLQLDMAKLSASIRSRLDNVEVGRRVSFDLTQYATPEAINASRMSVPVFFTRRGDYEEIRIDSLKCYATGAGTIRFALYEWDGILEGGTLIFDEFIGEVTASGAGPVSLVIDGGYHNNADNICVLAVSSEPIIGLQEMMGLVMKDSIFFEDADYTAGGSISTTSEGDELWVTGADYSLINAVSLEEALGDADARLNNLERWPLPDPKENDGKVVVARDGGYVLSDPSTVAVEIDATLSKSGVAADAKATGDRLKEIENRITDLHYKPISIESFKVSNGGIQEKGSIVYSVPLIWMLNKAPDSITSLRLEGESIPVDTVARSISYKGGLTKDEEFLLEATDEKNRTATKTTWLHFYNGVYYGAAAMPETIDSSFILGLSKKVLTDSKVSSITVNAGTDEYIWYCLPVSMGECTFVFGANEVTFIRSDPIEFENSRGHKEPYYVYRSENAGLGETTVGVS